MINNFSGIPVAVTLGCRAVRGGNLVESFSDRERYSFLVLSLFALLLFFSPLLSIAFTIAKIFDAVPILRHVDYGWAFLPLTIWLLVAYVRRWSAFQDQIELPRASPLSLTAMSAWDIAQYLLSKSAWGWRKYDELNFREFVRDAVPEEMDGQWNPSAVG